MERLTELGGAARRGDLLGRSAPHRKLDELVRSGLIVDQGGGCYALPGAAEWRVRAEQFRAVLTCVSWANEFRLSVLRPPTRVHLAVPASRHVGRSAVRPDRAVVLHRSSALKPGSRPAPPIAPAAVAIACVLRCLDPLAAIVTVDSALNRGACTVEDLRVELKGPGSVNGLLTLNRCDGRSESVLESMARSALRGAGLRVEVNVQIPGVGRVDLLVEGKVVVELDGFEYHGSRRAFADDRRRDRALVARGFVVLRFTYEDVLPTSEVLVEAVRAALAAPPSPNMRLG